MALDIEFGSRRHAHPLAVRVLWLGALAMCLSLIMFTSLWLTTNRLKTRLAANEDILKLRSPQTHTPVQLDPKRNESIRRTSRELDANWDVMFRSVEESHFDAITLLEIDTDAAGESLRISGTGQSYADVLGFVDRLSRRPIFSDVLLVSHQASGTAPGSPIKFVLTSRWHAV